MVFAIQSYFIILYVRVSCVTYINIHIVRHCNKIDMYGIICAKKAGTDLSWRLTMFDAHNRL